MSLHSTPLPFHYQQDQLTSHQQDFSIPFAISWVSSSYDFLGQAACSHANLDNNLQNEVRYKITCEILEETSVTHLSQCRISYMQVMMI